MNDMDMLAPHTAAWHLPSLQLVCDKPTTCMPTVTSNTSFYSALNHLHREWSATILRVSVTCSGG